MELVLIFIIILFVAFKLGLFNPVIDLTEVATRESKAYNRSHKAKTATRYANMATDIDAKAVNANIKKIDDLKFD